MSTMDRRDFVKTISAAAGTAMLAGLTPAEAAAKDKPVKPGEAMYEVFAVKYAGPFERKMAMLLFNNGWAEDMSIYYYIWVIRAKNGETTLVDTGVGPNLGPKFKGFIPPQQLVANLGVKPEQVTRVVLTHMHFDHVGGMEDFPKLFPKAKFYVQKKELDFWTGPLAQRAPYKLLGYAPGTKGVTDLPSSRLVVVNGDKTIAPGMELLLSTGHTPGLQTILLPTAKGQTIVGSDCAHLFRSYKEDIPSGLITDLPGWLVTYEKLRSKAPVENMFPGHDAKMATDFPTAVENVTRLA